MQDTLYNLINYFPFRQNQDDISRKDTQHALRAFY